MIDKKPFQSISAVGDNINSLVEQHIDLAFRGAMHGPGVTMENRFLRLLTGEPHPFGNIVLVSHPPDLQATTEAIKPLCDAQMPGVIFFCGRIDDKVEAFVRSRGFNHPEPMTGMAVEIDRLPETSLPAGYEFVRVGSREGEAWSAALAGGFEFPLAVGQAFNPARFGPGLPPAAPFQFFAIRKDGRFVSTSMLYLKNGLAGIYCVSTIPQQRGNGLAAHVTAEPLRRARELGYGVGILQATAAGYPVYKRLSFADFGTDSVFARTET